MSAEFDLLKRSIDVQVEEYERDLKAFAAWMEAWKARQPKALRQSKSSGG